MSRRAVPVAIVALWVLTLASAAPAAELSKISTNGSHVTGELAAGQTLKVSLHIVHPQGWQHLRRIRVDLRLRGRALDQLIVDPVDFAVSIVGGPAPVSIGQPGNIRGSYFALDPAGLGFRAQGKILGLTLPIRLIAGPPPGARMFFSVDATGAASVALRPLTAPVPEDKGFSWGTLGVAVVAALFLGGFVGNIFSSRRRPQRPSIYAAVQRRIDQEHART